MVDYSGEINKMLRDREEEQRPTIVGFFALMHSENKRLGLDKEDENENEQTVQVDNAR